MADLVFLKSKTLRNHPDYIICENGDVYSLKSKRILSQTLTHHGYLVVTLDNKKYLTHRLLARIFIPNPKKLPIVNHKDLNKENNNLDNLEWVSRQENCLHAIKNGVKHKGKPIYQFDLNGNLLNEYESIHIASEKTGLTRSSISKSFDYRNISGGYIWSFIDKYSPPRASKKCKPVEQFTLEGNLIKSHESVSLAAKELGLSQANISSVCSGKTKTCGGYIWKFKKQEPEKNQEDFWKAWITLDQFPEYCISKDGQVFSKKTRKLLKSYSNGGYASIKITNRGGYAKGMSVHRLVALAYLPNPNNLPVVNHLNCIKTDNRVENLEWASFSDNLKHSWDSERYKGRKTTKGYKFKHQNANSKKVSAYKDGILIETFTSVSDASRKYNMQRSNITASCNGKKTTRNRIDWRFE